MNSAQILILVPVFKSSYTPEELKKFPLGTVMEMPKPPQPPAPYIPPQQEADSEESDDISLPVS